MELTAVNEPKTGQIKRMEHWLKMRAKGHLPDVLHQQWKREFAALESTYETNTQPIGIVAVRQSFRPENPLLSREKD